MIPKSIKLRSFKCFSGEFTYHFPQKQGLYLVQGRNEVQADLEGNGCGKSTLFCDAITWCLYGKTPRLLKASDILNWDVGSAASVLFEFDLNGETYSVLRTQSPNSLCLDVNGERRVITQDQLNDLIKLDFDSFISSVVFSQFGTMFFDLGPTDKSAVLSNILDLSVWDQATDQAKKSLSQLEMSVVAVKERIAHANGQLSTWLERDYTAQIEEWFVRQAEKRENLEKSLQENDEKLLNLKKKGVKVEENLSKSQANLQDVDEIRDEILEEVSKIEKRRAKLQDSEKKLQFELDSYTKELKKFESVTDVCPYCKQKVSESHVESQISDLQSKIQVILGKINTLRKEFSAENISLAELNEDLSAVRQTKSELSEENATFTTEKQNLKLEMAKIMGSTQQLNKELSNLGNLVNPFVAEQKKQQESVKILEEKIKLDQKELEKLDKNVFATQYWTKAFKDVRLSLISDVLVQLELEVNNKLFQLGLKDWKVLFAVEGLTKGGKVKKGFTVTISTPQNLDPVPWAAWSGGETQRLRLAGALGMADLIASKSGLYPEFEVLDEPSQFLSTSGIDSLLEILKDRARTQDKSIFLIDHRNLNSESFDNIFTVVKTSDGVVVE